MDDTLVLSINDIKEMAYLRKENILFCVMTTDFILNHIKNGTPTEKVRTMAISSIRSHLEIKQFEGDNYEHEFQRMKSIINHFIDNLSL
ncbi:MAG: hypothetical protein ABIA02_02710 [Candidatus Falkowbacteria bacterium]